MASDGPVRVTVQQSRVLVPEGQRLYEEEFSLPCNLPLPELAKLLHSWLLARGGHDIPLEELKLVVGGTSWHMHYCVGCTVASFVPVGAGSIRTVLAAGGLAGGMPRKKRTSSPAPQVQDNDVAPRRSTQAKIEPAKHSEPAVDQGSEQKSAPPKSRCTFKKVRLFLMICSYPESSCCQTV